MLNLAGLLDKDTDQTDDAWAKEGPQWVLHREGKTLLVERVGWLFCHWRYRIVQTEGVADTLQQAMQKAEQAVTSRRPRWGHK